MIIRKSTQRGVTNLPWLKSRHTFSFGMYHDPRWQNFGSLRVINDDVVAPGMGFDTHSHRDMEIISIILSGALAHKDSLGTESVLKAGSMQVMSAGAGIRHSEYNPSQTEPVHFLQIWLEPAKKGGEPWYKEVRFDEDALTSGEKLLVGKGGAIDVGQDARISVINLKESDAPITKELKDGYMHWVHVVEGDVEIEGNALTSGDAVGVKEGQYTLKGQGRLLAFEVK